MRTTKIKRNGQVVILEIEMYQGNMALAYGNDGKMYIRKGKGMWREAVYTPFFARTYRITYVKDGE